MKLYRTHAASGAVKPRWAGSLAAAGKDRDELRRQQSAANAAGVIETTSVEVPTNKEGLLTFLNTFDK